MHQGDLHTIMAQIIWTVQVKISIYKLNFMHSPIIEEKCTEWGIEHVLKDEVNNSFDIQHSCKAT